MRARGILMTGVVATGLLLGGGLVTAPTASANVRYCGHSKDGVGHFDNPLVYWIDYYVTSKTYYDGGQLRHRHQVDWTFIAFGGGTGDGTEWRDCKVHSSSAASESTDEHGASEGFVDAKGTFHPSTPSTRPAWVVKQLHALAVTRGYMTGTGQVTPNTTGERRPSWFADLVTSEHAQAASSSPFMRAS